MTFVTICDTITTVIWKTKEEDWSDLVELAKRFIKFTIAMTFAILSTIIIVNADPGVVVGNGVNFRSGPGTEHQVLNCLPRGTFVTVDGAEGIWYKVTYNGVSGYMSSEYVSVRKGVDVDRSGLTVDRYGTSGASIVDFAAQFLGTPYVYGGTSPRGFDCSGFVYYVYSSFGYNLNRTAAGQNSNGIWVARENLAPGDIVLFNTSGGISHAGIFVGNDTFIHAVKPGTPLQYDSMSSTYYSSRYVSARRIIY